jgi:hypothetical protein
LEIFVSFLPPIVKIGGCIVIRLSANGGFSAGLIPEPMGFSRSFPAAVLYLYGKVGWFGNNGPVFVALLRKSAKNKGDLLFYLLLSSHSVRFCVKYEPGAVNPPSADCWSFDPQNFMGEACFWGCPITLMVLIIPLIV